MKAELMNIVGKIAKPAKAIVVEAGKRSPVILTGLAVAGVVTTVVLAVRASKEFEEAKKEREEALNNVEETAKNAENPDQESVKEERKKINWIFAKKIAKVFLPTFISATLTIGCIIGGQVISLRKQAALAAAYSVSESTLKDYTKKTRDIAGDEKADEIERAVAEKSISKGSIIDTGLGDDLFYDRCTGRMFRASTAAIEKAVNTVLREVSGKFSANLNTFYDALNLPNAGLGEAFGWDERSEPLDVRYVAGMTDWNEPYSIICYNVNLICDPGI